MSFLHTEYPAATITCPRCLVRYELSSDMLLKVKTVKCSNCQHIWAHHYSHESSVYPLPNTSNLITSNFNKEKNQGAKPKNLWAESNSIRLKPTLIKDSSEKNQAIDTFQQKPSNTDYTKKTKFFAIGLMLFYAHLLSTSGLFFRSMEKPDIWQISFYRGSALIVCVLVFLIIKYRASFFDNLFGIGFPGLFAGAMMGGAQLTYMAAMDNTTIANTTFTLCSIPFLTAGLAYAFLAERLSLPTVITMFVAGLGVLTMVWEGIELGSIYGNILAMLTALMFSAFAITVRKNRKFDLVPALLISGLVNVLGSLVVTGGEYISSDHDIILSSIWGCVQSICFPIFIIASRYLIAAEVTIFTLLEFSLAPLWVWLLMNETTTTMSLVGGAIVVSSVLVRTIYDISNNHKKVR